MTLLMGLADVRRRTGDPIPALYAGGFVGPYFNNSVLSSLFQDRSATPVTPAVVDGVVGTRLDLSGGGNHGIAPSDAARPILRTSGGKYWLEYDGIDDCFDISNVALVQNTTQCWAFQRAATGIHSIAFAPSAATRPYSFWWFSDNAIYEALGTTDSAGVANVTTGNFVGTSFRNGTESTLRLNGAQIGTRAPSAIAGSFNGIARDEVLFHNGREYASMIINRQLSVPEMVIVETYFAGLM